MKVWWPDFRCFRKRLTFHYARVLDFWNIKPRASTSITYISKIGCVRSRGQVYTVLRHRADFTKYTWTSFDISSSENYFQQLEMIPESSDIICGLHRTIDTLGKFAPYRSQKPYHFIVNLVDCEYNIKVNNETNENGCYEIIHIYIYMLMDAWTLGPSFCRLIQIHCNENAWTYITFTLCFILKFNSSLIQIMA